MTVVIEHSRQIVRWRDFGYQYDYAAFDQSETFIGIGPLTFDAAIYHALLQGFREKFNAP